MLIVVGRRAAELLRGHRSPPVLDEEAAGFIVSFLLFFRCLEPAPAQAFVEGRHIAQCYEGKVHDTAPRGFS